MRISTTSIQSYLLWRDQEDGEEWMPEEELIASIKGEFKGNRNTAFGGNLGKIIEHPDRYRQHDGTYKVTDKSTGITHVFDEHVIQPVLEQIPRKDTAFEVKATRRYFGNIDVVAKVDAIVGVQIFEFKSTLNSFDIDKYLLSCQPSFYLDIFEGCEVVTFKVFCLSENSAGILDFRSCQEFNLFRGNPAELHDACEAHLRDFVDYVQDKGLAPYLQERQANAATQG